MGINRFSSFTPPPIDLSYTLGIFLKLKNIRQLIHCELVAFFVSLSIPPKNTV